MSSQLWTKKPHNICEKRKEWNSELVNERYYRHVGKIWSVYFQTAGPWEDGPAVHDEMAKSDGDRQHSQKRTIASPKLARSALLE